MKVVHIYTSPEHNYFGHHEKPPGKAPMIEVAEVECVEGRGIQGDRFFDFKDNYKGQITFFSMSVYRDLCDQFAVFDKDPSAFRRNVIVDDVDLNSLIGETFELQGIQFEGTQEAAPCYWMEQAFCLGAEEALKGNGGLRARILSDGVLRAGQG